MSVDSDAQALIERLKAERAEKLAKATNGKASTVELLQRLATQEKPKRYLSAVVKPKLEIATPKVSDDIGAPLLERTLAALSKLDFTFTYDLFRRQYHIGDHALQQRI